MHSPFESIYQPLPRYAQQELLAARSAVRRHLRGGRLYRHLLDWLETTQWANLDQLHALQVEHLRSVLRHAIRYVAYYQEMAREAPGLARMVEDDPVAVLSLFPRLAKHDLAAHGRQMMMPQARRRALARGQSSGTTGTPVTVHRNLYSVNFEAAILARQWRWAGIAPGERRATLRGQIIMPPSTRRPPFWRYNRVDDQLIMSSFHLSAATVPLYVEELLCFRPAVLECYPSSLVLLAAFGRGHGIEKLRGQVRAVITSSETVHNDQRMLIEETFGCRLFDYYGSAERVSFIGTCDKGSYHLVPEYGWTEYLPAAATAEHGAVHLASTPFHNLAMPLVRYDTGDTIVPGQGSCACGRAFPLIEKIIGRDDDYVTTPDGRVVGRLDQIFRGLCGFAACQIIQEDRGHLILKVLPTAEYGPHVERELLLRLRYLVGSDMRWTVEQVEEIPRTAAGKMPLVVSRIKGAVPL